MAITNSIELKINKIINLPKREIIIERITDHNLINNEICIDLDSIFDPKIILEKKSDYEISAIVLKVDKIVFGHSICFYHKKENILYFGHFGAYGQIENLINLLVKEIEILGKNKNVNFIVGPFNLTSKEEKNGFNEKIHRDYIQVCKDNGFFDFINNPRIILIK